MFCGVFETHVALTKIRNVLRAQIMIRYYCLVTEKMLSVFASVHRDALSHLAQLDGAVGDCKVRFINKDAPILIDF